MKQTDEVRPHVLLFDADNPDLIPFYGVKCYEMVFDILRTQKVVDEMYSRIYSGDIILSTLSEKIKKVEKKDNIVTTHIDTDIDMQLTLATDLVSTIQRNFCSATDDFTGIYLLRHNVYCIVITHLSITDRVLVDSNLKCCSGFIGIFELDLNNLLQKHVFINNLINHGFIKEKIFYVEKNDIDEPDCLVDSTKLEKLVLDYCDYNIMEPSLIYNIKMSNENIKTEELIAQRCYLDHYQRIAVKLREYTEDDYHFLIDEDFSFEKINIHENKFNKYLLDFNHAVGKSKAKLFDKLLGIKKSDWRYLAAQIADGLSDGVLHDIRPTEYGVKYHVDMPILGLNSVSKTIRTVWIIREDGRVSFVTAYILDKRLQKNVTGHVSSYIKHSDDKGKYFYDLYELALNVATIASERIIPTPMFISGYKEPIMSGLCGYSNIVILDARRSFARWLRKNKIGNLHYKGGWSIGVVMQDQSFDRAKAYAEAFVKILLQNGIDCYYSAHYD